MAIKILSIDWDYYLDTDESTRHHCFPDGHDFGSSVGNSVWAMRYTHNTVNLENIGLIEDYQKLCQFFHALTKEPIDFMVTSSHIDAYDFINGLVKGNKSVEITNIDYHHDAYPCIRNYIDTTQERTVCSRSGKSVDCGNWLTAILQERKNAEVRWVAREDSDTKFAMADKEVAKRIRVISHKEALEDLYDVIFICRSDMWSCPHLDGKFNELWDIPNRKGFEILLNNRLYENRWRNVRREAKELKTMFGSFCPNP